MITHYQLTEMHAAMHDAANAFQRLMLATCEFGRTEAQKAFEASAARYRAAVEGATP